MNLIYELTGLWEMISITAIVSAITIFVAWKLHKEEFKVEIACIIFIVTALICLIVFNQYAKVPMPI